MSQTRRKGIEILRDEISDISRVVNTHSENITRRLERVKDMVAKYCAGKGDTVAPASSAAAPSASAASASSASASQPFSLSEQSPIPTPTVLGSRLNTIPEETNANLMESEEVSAPSASAAASAPLTKLRSKGPVSWDSFRSKVGEGTNLKTGKGNTLRQISSLWTQAKNGKSASEIEKYLKNELRIEPSLAAAKAPELEAIARNVIQKKGAIQKKGTTRKSLTASAPNAGAAASNAAVSSKKVTRRKKVSTAAAAPASESNDEFWSRMNKEATANNKRKTEAALALPAASQRVRNEAAAMARAQALKATPLTNKVSQTPFKSRPGVQIPTLVPSRSTTTVINPSTGEEEELSL